MKNNIQVESYREILDNNIILELNEKDIRFKDNKDINLKDSKLGEFGQILDVIINPNIKQRKILEEIYCDFLDCSSKDINKDIKTYSSYKINVTKFCLNKILKSKDQYSFIDLSIETEIEDKIEHISISELGKNSQIINIDSEKTIRIPTRFHVGIQKGKEKFILKTVEDYGYFAIEFNYKKGNEKYIDNFIEYFNELIQKNNFYKKSKITPHMEFLKLEDLDWSDVFLHEEVKEQILCNITNFYEKEEIYNKNGINSKCGLIWEGNPGTGKTLTAKILFNKLKDITCIWVTPDNVHSAGNIKEIYEIAKDLSPSLVFFEDADLYCVDRNYSRGNPILGEIMNQLDGLIPLKGIITVFTSNDPGVMEKALIDRPGRFDERIVFDCPSYDLIIKMIEKYLSIPKYNKKDLVDIAKMSEEMKLTGSHIKRLCDLSIIYAIKDDSLDDNDIAIIKKQHFENAVNKIKDMKIKSGEEKINYLKKITLENNTKPISIKEAVETKRDSLIKNIIDRL